MTLQKKILFSNILTVVLPVLMVLVVAAGYLHFHRGSDLKPISRASGDIDLLNDAMNILYTYEAEISEMRWDVAALPGEDEAVSGDGTGPGDSTEAGLRPEIVISPEKERVEDLKNLGYHLLAETTAGEFFSNLDDADREVLKSTGTSAEGAVFWSGGSIVIRDSFRLAGRTCYLTAVYNSARADQGVQRSLLPMYMGSPSLLTGFLLITAGCIALVSVLSSNWLSRSVLVPLQELKQGADRIAENDLDHPVFYAGRDEFGDVCSEFDRMRQQLKEARLLQKQQEEERRALLRGISHDLRSPLMSIRGYAQGLRDGIADTEEKKQRYCNAILTRTEDMERLTQSLSLLVKLENDRGLLRPEKVCLDEYIGQLLSEKESWLDAQKINVSYQTEDRTAEVLLDIREMQRVFMNLFENTVRYRTSERSEVRIEVLRRNGAAEIRFSDDGPGVGRKHLPHIFECFYRADESRTAPGSGSGIGLAVVKQIIEGQGGSISARSRDGLCIVMTLPLAERKDTEYEEDPDH